MGRTKRKFSELKKNSLRVIKSRISRKKKCENFSEKIKFSNEIIISNEKPPFEPDRITESQYIYINPQDLVPITSISEEINITNVNQESNSNFDVDIFIRNSLRNVTLKHNLPRNGLNDLLKELRVVFPSLPKDYRSLLNTPRETKLRIVKPGKYVHFSILDSIKKILHDCNYNVESIKIDCFVDGVAFFSDALIYVSGSY